MLLATLLLAEYTISLPTTQYRLTRASWNDLICDFPYRLANPLSPDLSTLTERLWYVSATTLIHDDSVSYLFPNSTLSWTYAGGYLQESGSLYVPSEERDTQHITLFDYYEIVNATNGEFKSEFYLDALRYRILKHFTLRTGIDVLVISMCSYITSTLSITILSSRVLDQSTSAGIYNQFREEFKRYYPLNYYEPVIYAAN